MRIQGCKLHIEKGQGMKIWMMVALAAGLPFTGHAGTYSIERHGVGGGGMATGGVYAARGIVCSAGGVATQETWRAGSGFFPDLSGAHPFLAYRMGADSLILEWDDYASAWQVQKITSLMGDAVWSNLTAVITWRGEKMQTSVDTAGQASFYRLNKAKQ